MESTKVENTPLAPRERIVVWILLILIKIVKPTAYTHEYKEELEKIKTELP